LSRPPRLTRHGVAKGAGFYAVPLVIGVAGNKPGDDEG
jgi:hypothetical protein